MWVIMLLNEKEKEALVIELLNKGLQVMGIAKKAQVSFTFIKKIRSKITGDFDKDEKKNPLSIQSRAFKLFLSGRSIVQVAIGLDLPTDQFLKVHADYLVLRSMGRTSNLLMENGKDLDAYLKLLDYVKGNGIRVKDLNHAIDLAQNIDSLKKEKTQLECNIDTLMDEKKYYQKELDEKIKENTTKSVKAKMTVKHFSGLLFFLYKAMYRFRTALVYDHDCD
jgi:hypothetical protein